MGSNIRGIRSILYVTCRREQRGMWWIWTWGGVQWQLTDKHPQKNVTGKMERKGEGGGGGGRERELRDLFWFKCDLGQKHQAPQVRPYWSLKSWPWDHDSTFHVTEPPALTTQSSVTVRLQYNDKWSFTMQSIMCSWCNKIQTLHK